jgi:cation transport regulator ChaC/acyl dehydratase
MRPSGADGQLAREDFTPERVRAYQAVAAQFGDGQVMSEEAREASRQVILRNHAEGQDLWIFGYGSLMWNPAINVVESRPAFLHGFSRRFAMRLVFGRAMPDRPGLMMCLVPGGHCHGIAHRIAADFVDSESRILWMREMLSGAYTPSWVDLDFGTGTLRGVTFVINEAHPRYLPGLDPADKAARIATAEGPLGSNRDYLFRTAEALAAHGLNDPYIDDMTARVRTRMTATGQAREQTMKVINYADISKHIGEETGVSEWVLIDQDRVNKFADATGDHQWIHIDVERAKRELPTKGTIAHGYLTLSLIPFLASKISRIDGVSRGINYGSNKVRFTNMVPVGSRVRARSKIIAAEPKGPGTQITNEVTIEIEGQDRPACIAETISIVYP